MSHNLAATSAASASSATACAANRDADASPSWPADRFRPLHIARPPLLRSPPALSSLCRHLFGRFSLRQLLFRSARYLLGRLCFGRLCISFCCRSETLLRQTPRPARLCSHVRFCYCLLVLLVCTRRSGSVVTSVRRYLDLHGLSSRGVKHPSSNLCFLE